MSSDDTRRNGEGERRDRQARRFAEAWLNERSRADWRHQRYMAMKRLYHLSKDVGRRLEQAHDRLELADREAEEARVRLAAYDAAHRANPDDQHVNVSVASLQVLDEGLGLVIDHLRQGPLLGSQQNGISILRHLREHIIASALADAHPNQEPT